MVSIPGTMMTQGAFGTPGTVCKMPGIVFPFSKGISTRSTGASSNSSMNFS